MSETHDYSKYANNYAELGFSGTFYLAFRDIPMLLTKYSSGCVALDYGCGAGRSTRFLRSNGFNVVGVDISEDMISQAKKIDPNGEYLLINSAEVPFEAESFDLIFSSYVFLEVSSRQEIVRILSEFNRLLKKNGIIIFVTSILTDYKSEFVSFDYNFPENNVLLTDHCTNVKLLIKEKNIILYDYNYTDTEYRQSIDEAGLELIELYNPVTLDTDPIEWLDEKNKVYSYIYILKRADVL